MEINIWKSDKFGIVMLKIWAAGFARLSFGSNVTKCDKEVAYVNPLNAELNPIRHLLALVGARHIVHVSRIRVKSERINVWYFRQRDKLKD